MSYFSAIRQLRLFSFRIASFHFNPGLLSSVITVALLYIMISLGFWQLDRAEYKDALQQKIVMRKSLAPVGFDVLPASVDSRRYLPVTFKGEFDTAHNFLLDNKIANGRVGYHLFTPVRISEHKTILVNRGFMKQGETRDNLPDFKTPDGKIVFRGLLDLPPPKALVLADNVQDSAQWPVVLQYVDMNEISKMLGYDLYDMVLWLDKDQAGSMEYDLPVLNLNSAKNNGYAFQWFALSFALLLIYIIVNTKRNN